MGETKTPAVPAGAVLRLQVVSRAGRVLEGVDVSLDSPARSVKTDATGFARLSVTSAELDALSPAGTVTIRIKKRHHGPLPSAGGKVVPSAIVVTAAIEKKKGFADGTPGLVVQKEGSFLKQVLVDAGYNFGATTLGTPTRRLTTAEVQRELLVYHLQGDVTLTPATELQFVHDTASGEFAPCDPSKCVISTPAADKWVRLAKNDVAGIVYFYFADLSTSLPKPTDKLPGQHFLRDKLIVKNTSLQFLDQRHLVGMVRLSKKLKREHGIVAIYTIGVNGDTERTDCHGHGCAVDFAGAATELPATSGDPLMRMGVDFVVFNHWGRVPMWDGKTVAANPTTPSTWKRQSGLDDDADYSKDKTGTTNKLHYRLDPAPFQDPVPALGSTPDDVALAAKLATIAPHFVAAATLFRVVYEFATAEYSDRNEILGPLPPTPAGGSAPNESPTPMSGQEGHFIFHADYPIPNAKGAKDGRQAHINHLHFQVGPTHYKAARSA